MGDLWGVASYFNPVHYPAKVQNFRQFAHGVRNQGLNLLIVELAFNEDPFVLGDDLAEKLIRVRSDCVLWQKERLLNIGAQHLPSSCDKLVWLDGDIAFGNNNWVSKTTSLLDSFMMVQPYDVAWWLPPNIGSLPTSSTGSQFQAIKHGFAFTQDAATRGSVPNGHPGFAWGMRRELIEIHGLYDRFIVGGGDLANASAPYNDIDCPQMRSWLGQFCTPFQIEDYVLWRNAFRADVKSRVGYVEGTVFHWWHGAKADRQHTSRHLILRDANFDPQNDITLDKGGCWKWNSHKPNLHKSVTDYFWARNEQ
ncbi:hypothetical protein EDE15_4237 [Edaphobacter aggregans]|uniref:Nucleotide-diphospho-sugar transferase n=1 Tax=Edaphobacter aggregans TaxID=570835 RepID=A0A3R9WJJ4_9BACT|nr:hypothetical protein [Edaphobacter aggregans]RSL18645.1 hypothetical protein EDE15_4237 [Edaphobacter aggregans]